MAWTSPKTYSVGDVLTAADLNTYQRDNFSAVLPNGTTWQTYTPSLNGSTTDPTLGTGSTADGRYYQIGQLLVVQIDITFGTSGAAAGSGNYTWSLPTAVDTTLNFARVGSGLCRDDSSGSSYVTVANVASASSIGMFTDSGQVGASSPFTWTNNDWIRMTVMLEV